MKQQLFTSAEVANILCVHPQSVRFWIREGALNAAKIGTRYLVSRESLKAFWVSRGGDEDYFEVLP